VAALASAPSAAPAEPATLAVRAENERISQLESDSVALRSELAELRQQFAEFRKQFE
jgi:septal ring factor EnvC (AmiA/AmiB activator)